MRDWVLPSERFVPELVTSTTATSPVVAYERKVGVSDARLRTYCIGSVTSRVPERRRRRLRRGLIAAVAVVERARILHAHLGYWAPEASAAARKLHLPLVVSLHGHDLLVEARSMEDARSLLDADVVIVPSTFLAEAALEFGISEERLRIIPSGVNLARVPFAERRPTPGRRVIVTFAGRFVEKKGVLDAAEALARVRVHRPEVEARFVGYGPLEHQLRQRVTDIRLPAQILDGSQPGAITSALADTHLVVTPSRTAPDGDAETLGLVNLEAQASGIPVVTTRHGGIPEAVCPDATVLVGEGDVVALADAINHLLDRSSCWPQMGRAGRAHVARHFDIGDQVGKIEDQYNALLEVARP